MDPFVELGKGNFNPTLNIGGVNKSAAEMDPKDLRNWISELGMVVGAIGGSFAGPAGAVAGGAGGAAVGSALEQLAQGKNINAGNVAGEALVGGLLARTPYETAKFLTAGLNKQGAQTAGRSLLKMPSAATVDRALMNTGLKPFTPTLATEGISVSAQRAAAKLASELEQSAPTTFKPTLNLAKTTPKPAELPSGLPKKTPGLMESPLEEAPKALKGSVTPVAIGEAKAPILRGTTKVREADIVETLPNIELKRAVEVGTNTGARMTIPKGEKLTPYRIKNGQYVLQDGKGYYVSPSTYETVRKASYEAVAKPFGRQDILANPYVQFGVHGYNKKLNQELEKYGYRVNNTGDIMTKKLMMGEKSSNPKINEILKRYNIGQITFDEKNKIVAEIKKQLDPTSLKKLKETRGVVGVWSSVMDKYIPDHIKAILDKYNQKTINDLRYAVQSQGNFNAVSNYRLPLPYQKYLTNFLTETNAYQIEKAKVMALIERLNKNQGVDAIKEARALTALRNKYPYESSVDFTDSHWQKSLPNLVAHSRAFFRKLNNELVYHVEEYQSDFMQKLGAALKRIEREKNLFNKGDKEAIMTREAFNNYLDVEKKLEVNSNLLRRYSDIQSKLWSRLVDKLTFFSSESSTAPRNFILGLPKYAKPVKNTGFTKSIYYDKTLSPKGISSVYNKLSDQIALLKLEQTQLQEQLNKFSSDFFPELSIANDWLELLIEQDLKNAVANKAKYFAVTTEAQTRKRWGIQNELAKIEKGSNITNYNTLGSTAATYLSNKYPGQFDAYQNLTVAKLYPKSPEKYQSPFIDLLYDKNTGIIVNGPQNTTGKYLSDFIGQDKVDLLNNLKPGQKLQGAQLRLSAQWPNTIYTKKVFDIIHKKLGIDLKPIHFPGDFNLFQLIKVGEDNAGFPIFERIPVVTKDIKVGQTILLDNFNTRSSGMPYIVAAKSGDKIWGKPVSKLTESKLVLYNEYSNDYQKVADLVNTSETGIKINPKNFYEPLQLLSDKSTTLNGFKITPHIERIVEGKAPVIETSGMKFENPTAAQIPKSTIVGQKAYYGSKMPKNIPSEIKTPIQKGLYSSFYHVLNTPNLKAGIKQADSFKKKAKVINALRDKYVNIARGYAVDKTTLGKEIDLHAFNSNENIKVTLPKNTTVVDITPHGMNVNDLNEEFVVSQLLDDISKTVKPNEYLFLNHKTNYTPFSGDVEVIKRAIQKLVNEGYLTKKHIEYTAKNIVRNGLGEETGTIPRRDSLLFYKPTKKLADWNQQNKFAKFFDEYFPVYVSRKEAGLSTYPKFETILKPGVKS